MSEEQGCWVAACYDRSGVYVFGSELDALRFANQRGGQYVAFVEFGHEVFEKAPE